MNKIQPDESWTPLHYAVYTAAPVLNSPILTDTPFGKEVAEKTLNEPAELIKQGTSVNASTKLGYTPLHIAVDYRYPNMVDILLLHGADPNQQDHLGRTPLFYLIERSSGENRCSELDLVICQQLLTHGADLKIRDGEGKTVLHAAAEFHNPDLVGILLGSGAEVNARDNKGRTPLFLAGEEEWEFSHMGSDGTVFTHRQKHKTHVILRQHGAKVRPK